MELSEIIPHIEALIFASDRPLTSLDLVDLINNAFGFMEEQITLDQVETALEGIREKYSSDFYPFEVFQSGGGWQFLSKPSFHTTIAQLNGGKFLKKLSNAALETLAIIAYKQPITKGEIESIRGVNSDYSVQKLLEKELIIISGRNEELPGKPLIYETSKSFMDYFGLNSTTDLPKIKEVLAEQFEPTFQQRNIEENVDFGIFSKFNENKEGTDGTDNSDENNTENTSSEKDDMDQASGAEHKIDSPADSNTASEAELDPSELEPSELDPSELELSDGENREAIQDASEDLEDALHPDLSSISPILSHTENSNATEDIKASAQIDGDQDSDGDAEEEELADLEADQDLMGIKDEEDEDEVDEEEEDDVEEEEEDEVDDDVDEEEEVDDEEDDELEEELVDDEDDNNEVDNEDEDEVDNEDEDEVDNEDAPKHTSS